MKMGLKKTEEGITMRKGILYVMVLTLIICCLAGCSLLNGSANSVPSKGGKTAQEKVEYIKNDQYFGYVNDWGWDSSEISSVLGLGKTGKSLLKGYSYKIYEVDGQQIRVDYAEGYAVGIEILR